MITQGKWEVKKGSSDRRYVITNETHVQCFIQTVQLCTMEFHPSVSKEDAEDIVNATVALKQMIAALKPIADEPCDLEFRYEIPKDCKCFSCAAKRALKDAGVELT